jgi:hypothetical protein
MISKSLTRRLEELEARFPPPREPLILQIVGVSPDGSKTDGPMFIVPLPATPARDGQPRPRWR